MSMQQWEGVGDIAPFDVVNENFESLGQASLFAQRQAGHTGLTVGYYGGPWNGSTYADGTVACTDNATNYIVALRANGVVSASTGTTSWNDANLYGRIARAVFAAGVLTWHDARDDPGGWFDRSGVTAQGTELKGLTFTSDTDSTADSDPGNGLFKWNNATQGSATKLFIDNQTADGASLTTLWGSLGQAGMVYIQQGDDAARWQLWRWTAVTDDTGYRDFTVALQAKSSSDIQDAKACYFDFDEDDAGGGSVTGPGSSTDNALARWDGTGGTAVQNSGVVVSDTDELSGYLAKINFQTGTTYTIDVAGADTDAGKIIDHTNAAAITVTLPNSAPVGFACTYVQTGAGQITFSAAVGGSLSNRQSHTRTAGNAAMVSLYVRNNAGGSAAAWVLGGDTAP